MNTITVIGRLTKDVEIRQINDGKSIATLSIASKGKTSEDTDFFDAKAFNQTANSLHRYLKKGDLLVATGSMHQYTYQKQDGTTVKGWEFIIDKTEFAGGGAKKEATHKPQQDTTEQVGDLPF